MRVVATIIFSLALLVLATWLLLPIALVAARLEFADRELLRQYDHARIWIVPLAILGTLFKTLKRSDDAEAEGRKMGCSAVAAIGMMFFGMIVVFLGSDEQADQFLRYDGAGRIVLREGVGPCRIERWNFLFNRVTEVDTTGVNLGAGIPGPQAAGAGW